MRTLNCKPSWVKPHTPMCHNVKTTDKVQLRNNDCLSAETYITLDQFHFLMATALQSPVSRIMCPVTPQISFRNGSNYRAKKRRLWPDLQILISQSNRPFILTWNHACAIKAPLNLVLQSLSSESTSSTLTLSDLNETELQLVSLGTNAPTISCQKMAAVMQV